MCVSNQWFIRFTARWSSFAFARPEPDFGALSRFAPAERFSTPCARRLLLLPRRSFGVDEFADDPLSFASPAADAEDADAEEAVEKDTDAEDADAEDAVEKGSVEKDADAEDAVEGDPDEAASNDWYISRQESIS